LIAYFSIFSRWEHALGLFNSMQSDGVMPNTFTFNALVTAFNKSREWGRSVEILKSMDRLRVKPNVATFTAIQHAHAQRRETDIVVELLSKMETRGVMPNKVSYCTAIEALDAEGRTQQGMELFRVAHKRRLFENCLSLEMSEVKKIDLHGCSVAVARTVLRVVLSDFRKGNIVPSDMMVLTGRGNGTPDGASVLAEEMRSFLKSISGPFINEVRSNSDGCFQLKKEAIETWLSENNEELIK